MKVIGYPKLDHHRELHNGHISGLNSIMERNQYHILNHDKKYFEFYQEELKLNRTITKGIRQRSLENQ